MRSHDATRGVLIKKRRPVYARREFANLRYNRALYAHTSYMRFKKLKSFVSDMKEKRLTTVAGAWVFYFLTALLPTVFLLITAFGVFGVKLSTELVGRLPEEFRLAGETIIATAENASGGVTVFFIATVLFSGSALINQMLKDGAHIYGEKPKTKNGILRRLWAIFALCILFLIFLAAAFLAAFKNMLFPQAHIGGGRRVFFTAAVFSFIISLTYIIIILLNKFISPVKLKISTVLWGSFLSLAVIVAGTLGFIVYLRLFNSYNAFYGSLAAIIIFLLWAYIVMTGLVFGVTVNMRIYKKDKKAAARARKAAANQKTVISANKTVETTLDKNDESDKNAAEKSEKTASAKPLRPERA